jgi:hypothetical protein
MLPESPDERLVAIVALSIVALILIGAAAFGWIEAPLLQGLSSPRL